MTENIQTTQSTAVPTPVVIPVVVTPEVPKLNVFGRPREYDPAYHLTQTRLYLDNPATVITVRDYSVNGPKNLDYGYKSVKLPTVAGLASFMKIHRSTIYEWAKIYTDFSDMLEELQAAQEQVLLENGLTGTFNSAISKLMLTKHGYADKTDITTNGKDITQQDKALADAALDKFLTKKPDGHTTDTSNTGPDKDIAPVPVQPDTK